jgi:hypothetical protein
LADVWCETVEASEYSFFLLSVHKKLADETNKTKTPFMKPYIYQSKEEMIKLETKMSVEKRFKHAVEEEELKPETPKEEKRKGVSFKSASAKKKKHAPHVMKRSNTEKDMRTTKDLEKLPAISTHPFINATVTVKEEENIAKSTNTPEDQSDVKENIEEEGNISNIAYETHRSESRKRTGSISSLSSQPHVSFRGSRGRAQSSRATLTLVDTGSFRDMNYFHRKNNAEHKARVKTAKPKYMDKAMQMKPLGPMTLEKVILHQMRHSHSTVNGDFPKSYVHLSGFIEMGIVNTDDIYGQKRSREYNLYATSKY